MEQALRRHHGRAMPEGYLLPGLGILAICAAERKGTQEMLPGSKGGGGQCQAHMPLGHYKCPGGGQKQEIHHQPSRKRVEGAYSG